MSIDERFRMDGRVVLITGGGGGLGRAMAKAFAEMGADVALTARSVKRLEGAAGDVRATGRRAVTVAADITDPAAPGRIVETVLGELGGLNVLVNNAGGLATGVTPGPMLEASPADWQAMLDLNLSSTLRMTQACVPHMADGGSVLLISSVTAFRPNGSGAYGLAKAAINHMALALSQDLAPRIRVNALAPGPVATFGFRRANGVEAGGDTSKIAAEWGVPLGRVGVEDDVSAAAIFLSSPAGSWITGQTLVVAGGL